MWKKIKPWHIIVALLVITAIILIAINWTAIATKLGISTGRRANSGNGNGTNGSGRVSTGNRTLLINQILSKKPAGFRALTTAEMNKLNSFPTSVLQQGVSIVNSEASARETCRCNWCGWLWFVDCCGSDVCGGSGGTGIP